MTKTMNIETLSPSSKVLGSTGKRLPPNAGKGRKRGVPNKLTGDVRSMVAAALDDLGGVDYLVLQADLNPVAFLALVAKLIPTQVSAEVKTIHGLAERLEAAQAILFTH